MKGKTKSGFEYKLTKERLNNYELVEALNELDDNPLVLSTVINMLLGKEQAKKLKDHLRDENGLVPTDKLTNEIQEIFNGQKNVKK